MTDPEEDSGADTKVAEFTEILAPQDGGDSPVVVGGHAVNLWSDYFLRKGVMGLASYMPFTSKDLDLVGSVGLLERLHQSHKGKLTRSEPRSPVLGRIDIKRKGGGFLRVEVLHGVKGLSSKELTKTMELKIQGLVARVLLPHLILKAKIENTESISQEGRNDVKHVKMMILCVRAFIVEFAGFVTEGKVSESALVNLLEETREAIRGSRAEKASRLWGFDFSAIWPMVELEKVGGGKIVPGGWSIGFSEVR